MKKPTLVSLTKGDKGGFKNVKIGFVALIVNHA